MLFARATAVGVAIPIDKSFLSVANLEAIALIIFASLLAFWLSIKTFIF